VSFYPFLSKIKRGSSRVNQGLGRNCYTMILHDIAVFKKNKERKKKDITNNMRRENQGLANLSRSVIRVSWTLNLLICTNSMRRDKCHEM